MQLAGQHRHPLDLAQHVRSFGCVRLGVVSVTRPHPARRRSQNAATGTRQGHARRVVHRRRAPTAHLGCGMSAMSGHRIYAIVLRQFYLIRGSFARVFPLFAWVAVDMVLWGFISKYLNSVTATGMKNEPTQQGTEQQWDFLVRVMQGVTM